MLDANTINGFVRAFLHSHFDDPSAIPSFHQECWAAVTSKHKQVAIAAPRGHAKSTGITLTYVLASVLFKQHDYVLIVSKTEGVAAAFLLNIKEHLRENKDIIDVFGVRKLVKDTETEVVVLMDDGHKFRIQVKGGGQQVRGLTWNSKRPGLIIMDDVEDDAEILNPERRMKFRQWVQNALIPCGSRKCMYRVIGTILHFDSYLERILNDPTWHSLRYSAHAGFDDFSDILWSDRYDEDYFRQIRQGYINQGNADGYSQEYLNVPIAEGNSFFRRQDFLVMEPSDRLRVKRYYAAVDFAITQKTTSDYTAIAVMGMDSSGVMHIVDMRRGRWDSLGIIEEMFNVQKRYDCELFVVETGAIEKALGPILKTEMLKRGIYLPLHPVTPTKDKLQRAHAFSYIVRAGGMRFDKEADWYLELEEECVRFPRGKHDDMVDALAWLGLVVHRMVEAQEGEVLEAEYDEVFEEEMMGKSAITGY